MGMYDWNGYGPYVSKAEKIRRALKTRKKMAKKGVVLEPVIVEGRTISRTWWGQSWIKNLERYADYSNRLSRGRSYLRNGSLLDLKIESKKITGLVCGSSSNPYKITISIKPVEKAAVEELMEKSRESLDSMQSLLAGEFPVEIKDQFFNKNTGLFPSPMEITLNCSCPDWANMCKHVAAVLYGAAVRLDEKPELFFTLRGIDINKFVVSVAKDESAKLLQKADIQSSRHLALDEEESGMEELFGISIDRNDTVPVDENEKSEKLKKDRSVKKKVSDKICGNKKSRNGKVTGSNSKPREKTVKSIRKNAKKAAQNALKINSKKAAVKKAAVKKAAVKKAAVKKAAVKKTAVKKTAVKKTAKRV
ncbi:MAG: hypothetical protein GXY77_15840 [Fibrobacter sp.]|nr:hypothetical protein [Fibrobacter sp.]